MDIDPVQDTPADLATAIAASPMVQCDPPDATGSKIWRAGTLTYTTAALVPLFCWLLWGDFAWSMKDRSTANVPLKLFHKFGASDTLVATLVVSLPQLITMILGPIVAYKSDRHRGRWGRRIPFIMIPTPIAAVSIVLFAFSPFFGAHVDAMLGNHSPGLQKLTLAFFGLFWICFEVASISANAVFNAFVNDVVPKPVICRFYGFFRALSLIAGMIFNYWIFGIAVQHYIPIFLGIGLLYGIGVTLMCMMVKEGDYPPPPADEGTGTPLLAIKSYFRDCFTKSYYYWVFAALIFPALAFLPINTFNILFANSVGVSDDRFGKLTSLYFFLSLLQTIPLGWLADKYHPLRVSMVALVLHGAASLWGGIFIHNPLTFAIAFVATGTLSGTWFTATAALTMSLMPKLKYAQYFSALAVVQSLVTMASAPIVGRFLDHTHHQYRYTYQAGFVLDALGLIATIIVFRKFMALGGTTNYVAPE